MELEAGQIFAAVVESLFFAEQLSCQAKQSVGLTAKQTAAADGDSAAVEKGTRPGEPTLAFPCWQMIRLSESIIVSERKGFAKC